MSSKKKKAIPPKNEKKKRVVEAKEKATKKIGVSNEKRVKRNARTIVIDDFIEIRFLENAIPKNMEKDLWRILDAQNWFPMKQDKGVKSDSPLILSLIRYGFSVEEIANIYTEYSYYIEKFKYKGTGHNRPAFIREIEELKKRTENIASVLELEYIFSYFRINEERRFVDQIVGILLAKEYQYSLSSVARINYAKLSWESGFSKYRIEKAIQRFVNIEILQIYSRPKNNGKNYDGCNYAFDFHKLEPHKVKFLNATVFFSRARVVNLFSPEIYFEYFREIPKSVYVVFRIIKTHLTGIETKNIIQMAFYHGLSDRVVYDAMKILRADKIISLNNKKYTANNFKKGDFDKLAQKLRKKKEKEKYKIGEVKISFPPNYSGPFSQR